jgi:hypothetical protein
MNLRESLINAATQTSEDEDVKTVVCSVLGLLSAR